jgi:predicted transcriptional regulator
LSDPTAIGAVRPKYKRKLSNYLLDKKLQLRYVIVVTLLSGIIAGVLGFMIFDQQRKSTESIEEDLQELVNDTEDVQNITGDYESQDRMLVYTMVGAGVGLVVILSLFLLVMTHKVAGPLFKTSIYFDRMAEGRLSAVTPLRRGDMLQDFFTKFKDTHDSIRARGAADVEAMTHAVAKLREARSSDPRGAALVEELDLLEAHLAQRKKQLV